MPVSDELREKVKKLAREYMTSPARTKQAKAREAGELMHEAGLEAEVAVTFWYELSMEVLKEMGLELPVPEIPEAS